MHDLNETYNFEATVTVPDDGVDYRVATSLSNFAIQQLTNRTRWLQGLLQGYVTGVDVSFRGNVFANMALQVLGLAQLKGNLTVAGTTALHATTVTGSLSAGETTIQGLTHLQAATDAQSISCTDLFTDGTTQIGTSLTDTCEVNASMNTRAPVRAYDSLTTVALLNISGGAALQSVANCIGTGRVVRKAVVGPQTGSSVLSVSAGTDYYFPVLTAAVTMQISDSGAVDGDEFNVSVDASGFQVNVVPVSGVGFLAGLKNASGFTRRIRLKRIGGSWFILDKEIVA